VRKRHAFIKAGAPREMEEERERARAWIAHLARDG
jgi:hypothetical protein